MHFSYILPPSHFSWAPKSLQTVTAAIKLKVLAPWKKSYANVLKSRDFTLPTKVCLIKAITFPVVMYRHGSWTIRKAENQRIDVFRLSYWKRLLTVPWTARSNYSVLKGINPEYS